MEDKIRPGTPILSKAYAKTFKYYLSRKYIIPIRQMLRRLSGFHFDRSYQPYGLRGYGNLLAPAEEVIVARTTTSSRIGV
jgi:hypothetical protein